MNAAETFKKLWKRFVNRETITYVIFGGLTTVVNFVVYHLFCNVWGIANLIANAIAWVAAVIFAYVTNNSIVFQSRFTNVKEEAAKIIKFFGARVFSFLIEEAGMLLMVDIAKINNLIAKLALAVIVVILNYIFSKLFIFKNKNAADKG